MTPPAPIGSGVPAAIIERSPRRAALHHVAVAEMRRAIPGRLRELQGDSGQRDFCRRVGLAQQSWQRYVHGVQVPHPDQLVIVANALGVSLDWLLLGVGGKQRRVGSGATRSDPS